jgi:hypothetical protein
VAELNRNLIDLGFDPYGGIEDDAHFGAATAAAVRRWQEAEHLPKTGEVELGRIVFAPGARRVTSVQVAVGQDPPPAPAAGEETAAGEEAAAKHQAEEEKKVEEEAAEAEEAKERAEAEKKAAAEAEKAEAKEKTAEEPEASEPASEESAAEEKPSGGNENPGPTQEGAAAEPVLTTTSTRQLVQVQLSAAEQGLAKVGKRAPVTLPDGEVVKSRITAVGKVAEAAEAGGPEGGGEESEPTISVTVALDHPVARLDEAPVRVELVKAIRSHVLAVPATALFATAGGRYGVEALKGGRPVRLAVTPGMFADGYVQVEGKGVHVGLTVTEPAE